MSTLGEVLSDYFDGNREADGGLRLSGSDFRLDLPGWCRHQPYLGAYRWAGRLLQARRPSLLLESRLTPLLPSARTYENLHLASQNSERGDVFGDLD